MRTYQSATVLCLIFLLAASVAAAAAPGRSEYKPPAGIGHRSTTIISEGTRLAGDLFWPESSEQNRLPTIIMSHGWGGVAAQLRGEAAAFATAGYLVLTFDYRGWGASDGRVVLASPAPEDRSSGRFTAEVIEIREVVDPLDQTTDLLNVLHWIQAEPRCDTERIGLWGSSYSGGHVVYAAARDPRVKATVSQVPALDSRFVVADDTQREQTYREATQRARGEIGYPEPGARVIGNLRGAPIREKLMRYAPVEDADKAPGCAMLFVIAEKEELFDNEDHAIKAHALAKGPKKIVTIPGITHYGIYLAKRAEAERLSLEWFDEHLKK